MLAGGAGMKPIEMIGLVTTSNPGFAKVWAATCRDVQVEQDAWIVGLRAYGVKAAHPDDGWVDRDHNQLYPRYPQFNGGVTVGDIIALGWPDQYRLVRVTGFLQNAWLGQMWAFDQITEPVLPALPSIWPAWIRELFGK